MHCGCRCHILWQIFDLYYDFNTHNTFFDTIFVADYWHHAFTYILHQHWSKPSFYVGQNELEAHELQCRWELVESSKSPTDFTKDSGVLIVITQNEQGNLMVVDRWSFRTEFAAKTSGEHNAFLQIAGRWKINVTQVYCHWFSCNSPWLLICCNLTFCIRSQILLQYRLGSDEVWHTDSCTLCSMRRRQERHNKCSTSDTWPVQWTVRTDC